jgi:hypothetical protein
VTKLERECALDIVDEAAAFLLDRCEPSELRESMLADLLWLRVKILFEAGE